jgi:hypothetical protein
MPGTESAGMINGYRYESKPDHRDGTRIKSQWDITLADEYAAFALGVTSGWVDGASAWSLHLNDGSASYLGRSAAQYGSQSHLFMAFFQLATICHGYPSDPARSSREVPPNNVRSEWLAKKYLRPAVIRKIGRGLTCKL